MEKDGGGEGRGQEGKREGGVQGKGERRRGGGGGGRVGALGGGREIGRHNNKCAHFLCYKSLLI